MITNAAVLGAATLLPKKVLGANDRIRIGLIGCGNRGAGNLMAGSLRLAGEMNIEIAALCDVWKVNLDKAATRLSESQPTKPATFRRYQDLLALKDVDAVMIATPDFAHARILVDALAAKKDVYVEKQMAMQLDLAKKAIALARKNRQVVQTGTQLRSYYHFGEGFKLVRSGILGKISHVETQYHHNYAHWARDFSNVRKEDVDWEQFLMDLPKEPFSAQRFRRWHLFRNFANDTPGLLGSHYIDMATWYMDDPIPLSAVAEGGVYVWQDGRETTDTINCTLAFPKGWLLTFTSRFGNNFPGPKIRFYGSRGSFDSESWTANGNGGGEGALVEPIPIAEPVKVLENEDDQHIRNWIECIRSRKPTMAPIEAGYAHSVAAVLPDVGNREKTGVQGRSNVTAIVWICRTGYVHPTIGTGVEYLNAAIEAAFQRAERSA
jgi:predicted dehydrogenase